MGYYIIKSCPCLIGLLLASILGIDAVTQPVFSGDYPASINVTDDDDPIDVLHTFTVTAEGVTPQLSFTFDPADTEGTFTITVDTSGAAGTVTAEVTLTPGQIFNFETREWYKITASATDGTLTESNKLLTINVLDVGEAPTLNPPTQNQTFNVEEGPLGAVIGTPNFTIDDLDNGDWHTWGIVPGTGATILNVNSDDGSLSFLVDYDLEAEGANSTIYIDVIITDSYGLSVTTTYIVIISDVNDNTPVLTPPTFSITTEQTDVVGTVYETLDASDADKTSPNNNITYSMGPQDLAGYFQMVGNNLTLKQTFDVSYGQVSNVFHVYAIDGGSTALTATATITVTTPTSTSTTPTTTSGQQAGYDWFKETNNIIMLAGATFMVALLIGYVLVLCWRWNTFGECMPTKCPTSEDLRQCCGGYPNNGEKNGRLNSSVIKPELINIKGLPDVETSQIANNKFRSTMFHSSRVTNL